MGSGNKNCEENFTKYLKIMITLIQRLLIEAIMSRLTLYSSIYVMLELSSYYNYLFLQVSWIRRRDAHILTVDRYTFIADDRFQAFLVEATDTWTLQIKYVQARDGGKYECQVSTEPKMSHFITLNVVGEYL